MSVLIATDVAPTGFRPVAETLPGAVERLVAALNPYKIILFGSYAYGQPTPDSDVDLLVVMETDLPPIERARQVMRLLRPRRFPVDVVVKTPAEVESGLQQGSPFLREALEKGVVLYERN